MLLADALQTNDLSKSRLCQKNKTIKWAWKSDNHTRVPWTHSRGQGPLLYSKSRVQNRDSLQHATLSTNSVENSKITAWSRRSLIRSWCGTKCCFVFSDIFIRHNKVFIHVFFHNNSDYKVEWSSLMNERRPHYNLKGLISYLSFNVFITTVGLLILMLGNISNSYITLELDFYSWKVTFKANLH